MTVTKKYQFFDKQFVSAKHIQEFLNNNRFEKCSQGRDHLFLASRKGQLYALDTVMNIRTFKLFDKSLRAMKFMYPSYIVAVGSDGDNIELVKVFQLFPLPDRSLSQNEMNKIGQLIEVERWPLDKLFAKLYTEDLIISALDVMYNCIALGSSKGHVVVLNGAIRGRLIDGSSIKGKISVHRLGETRHQGSYLIDMFMISNVCIKYFQKQYIIYITNDIYSDYVVLENGNLSDRHHLDPKQESVIFDPNTGPSTMKFGAKLGFAAVINEGLQPTFEPQFALGNGKSIKLYGEHNKLLKEVNMDEKITRLQPLGPLLGIVGERTFKEVVGTESIFKLYNPELSIITHTSVVSKKAIVEHIMKEWGFIFLIVRDTESRMNMLTEKNLTTQYKKLVTSKQFDKAEMIIHARNKSLLPKLNEAIGDHYFKYKQYSSAIDYYIRTLGYVQPSTIIHKFLSAQKIKELAHYLEALHDKARMGGRKKQPVSKELTTLLLNCYTKLNNVQAIDKFIKNKKFKYDIDTAIRVCRKSGYKRQALYLATTHQQHDWIIRMHLEEEKKDKNNYLKALQHIETLEFEDAERYLKQYSKTLMDELPEPTTNVLIRLCSGWIPLTEDVIGRVVTPSKIQYLNWRESILGKERDAYKHASVVEFLHIFSGKYSDFLITFLEYVIHRWNQTNDKRTLPPTVYNTLIQAYLERIHDEKLVHAIEVGDYYRKRVVKENSFYYLDENSNLLPLDENANVDGVMVPAYKINKIVTDQVVISGVKYVKVTKTGDGYVDDKGNAVKEYDILDIDRGRQRQAPVVDVYYNENEVKQIHSQIIHRVKMHSEGKLGFSDPSLAEDDVNLRYVYSCPIQFVKENMAPTPIINYTIYPLKKNDSVKHKCNEILSSQTQLFNQIQVLFLLKHYNYEEGLVKMYRNNSVARYCSDEIFKYHLLNGRSDEIIAICESNTQLWIELLSIIATMDQKFPDRCLEAILDHLKNQNILSPLFVIMQLSNSPHITLGTVQHYLTKFLNEQRSQIEETTSQLRFNREQILKKRKQIAEMRTTAKKFHENLCCDCNKELTVPSVHFMCEHSYHSSCIGSANECIRCKSGAIEATLQMDDHHQSLNSFSSSLNEKQMGLSYIGSCFKSGIMMRPDLETLQHFRKKRLEDRQRFVKADTESSELSEDLSDDMFDDDDDI
mmetsp:Transcript_2451/g.3570  ORF Transcript_2451/g.3570 Transcript_2451/m.3570 type:complete len:1179 (+) Transcript_2451:58-3594(+)